MRGRFPVVVVFCIVLFGAILAGYWNMLDAEKLRAVRTRASDVVSELTGADTDPRGEPQPNGNRQSAPATTPSPGSSPSAAESEAAGRQSASRSPDDPTALNKPLQAAGKGTSQPTTDAPIMASRDGDAAKVSSPKETPAAAPTFDVLRVEPDGATIFAGRAMPDADIRLLDAGKVLGTAKATREGAFAISLDDDLRPGDHQIKIEASRPGGETSTSVETAIVSVPLPGKPGDLLAMVESPDKPSRLIAVPRPSGSGAAAATTATAQPPLADISPAPGSSQQTRTDSREASTSPAGGTVEAPGVPAAPLADAVDRTAAAQAFGVEAVEIENGEIYVAGRAPGTAPVRIYVDNKLVGEDAKRTNGRFLVQAPAALPAGNHSIRADMIGAGEQVSQRVEVPFVKPEGDTMAAIAATASPPAPDGDTPGSSGGENIAKVENAEPEVPQAVEPVGSAVATEAPDTPAASAATAADIGSPSPVVQQADPSQAALPGATPANPNTTGPSGEAVAAAVEPAPATVKQPALTSVASRVLIRRGDTLWRISRQTYGLGHRYTVIYLANNDQIRNPNRIYPGQVFRLPEHDGQRKPSR